MFLIFWLMATVVPSSVVPTCVDDDGHQTNWTVESSSNNNNNNNNNNSKTNKRRNTKWINSRREMTQSTKKKEADDDLRWIVVDPTHPSSMPWSIFDMQIAAFSVDVSISSSLDCFWWFFFEVFFSFGVDDVVCFDVPIVSVDSIRFLKIFFKRIHSHQYWSKWIDHHSFQPNLT